MDRRISPNFELVDMGAFKISTARPLYTYGAATCMNVVVHNEATNIGGLAHVAVGGATAEFDMKISDRFSKADNVIKEMITSTGSPASSSSSGLTDKVSGGTEINLLRPKEPTGLESMTLTILKLFNNSQNPSVKGANVAIWLRAGSAFVDSGEDFPAYITKMLGPPGVTVRVIDDRNTARSDDVVYSPFNARVYKMRDGDLDFVRDSVKNAKAIQADRGEKLAAALDQYFKAPDW